MELYAGMELHSRNTFVKDFSTDLLATRMLDSLAFLDPGLDLGK